MDRNEFIDFNARYSTEKSGKVDSYDRAIMILDNVLKHQDVIDLHGQSLYTLSDTAIIDDVLSLVKEEVKKMKKGQPNIFDYGRPDQKSYPLKSFCSAALKSLKEFVLYEQEMQDVDKMVAHVQSPRTISKKLADYFDFKKEGEDVVAQTKRRKGQNYFRHMILQNYGGRCALTGIDIPHLLLASHIKPWADSTPLQKLNPENGICLSALYDKAFDKGLITISPDDYSVQVSSALREYETQDYYDKHFGNLPGRKITLPIEHKPNKDFLAYHRDHVFVGF